MSKKNSMTLACLIIFQNRDSNLQKTKGKIYQKYIKIYQKICFFSLLGKVKKQL